MLVAILIAVTGAAAFLTLSLRAQEGAVVSDPRQEPPIVRLGDGDGHEKRILVLAGVWPRQEPPLRHTCHSRAGSLCRERPEAGTADRQTGTATR